MNQEKPSGVHFSEKEVDILQSLVNGEDPVETAKRIGVSRDQVVEIRGRSVSVFSGGGVDPLVLAVAYAADNGLIQVETGFSRSSALTEKECAVFAHAVSGQSNLSIAREIGADSKYIRNALESMCSKLGVLNKYEAIARLRIEMKERRLDSAVDAIHLLYGSEG